MSISSEHKAFLKRLIGYLYFAAFLFVFQLIYNIFAHGVTSTYMTYAFLIPLSIGGFRVLIDYLTTTSTIFSLRIWQMGIVTLSVGSLLHGAFDIYGSSNELVPTFFYAAVLLFVLSAGYEIYVRVQGDKE